MRGVPAGHFLVAPQGEPRYPYTHTISFHGSWAKGFIATGSKAVIAMHANPPSDKNAEKRRQPRKPELRNHRIEVKLVGEPIYQFKLTDVSPRGAGIVVNKTSRFLKLTEIGQILEVNFLSPRGVAPSGRYKVEVRHITDTEHGHYKGVRRVGVRILEPLKTPRPISASGAV
jgi:hypothetical protein